jgi:hypothetical protein
MATLLTRKTSRKILQDRQRTEGTIWAARRREEDGEEILGQTNSGCNFAIIIKGAHGPQYIAS